MPASTALRNRLHHVRNGRDDGIGLILVIGTSAFVFTLVLAAAAYAISGVKQADQRTKFEQSLGVAEQGIDRTMSNLQTAFRKYNEDYPVPNNAWARATPAAPACALAPIAYPAQIGGTVVSDSAGTFVAAGGRTAQENEELWASQQLTTLSATPACVTTDSSGDEQSEYVLLKPATTVVAGSPPKYGKIYALSAIPSFAAASAKTRLVKAEYLFMPYRPSHAIQTGSDLEFQGNTLISPAAGVGPGVTGVHSNGNITVTGGATTIDGPMTATGSISGTANGATVRTPGADREDVPSIEADDFYSTASAHQATAVGGWYDLCDGVLKSYNPAKVPCGGTTIAGTTRNWSWDPSTRTWTAPASVLPGTYFAHNANIANGSGNGTITNLTLIASRDDTPTQPCGSRRYGNITWDHYDINTPSYPDMWFWADGDVSVTSNIKIGQNTNPPVSGMVMAGDQVELWTQSNSAVGAVVAGDQCKVPQPSDSVVATNLVHSDLYYDPNTQAPFTSVITNTLWLDYSN